MNFDRDGLLAIPQFSLMQDEKEILFVKELNRLHQHHANASSVYAQVAATVFNKGSQTAINTVADFPFLPVSIFKEFEVKSIPDDQVYKVLTSSGTTGAAPSRIYLNAASAALQTKALATIISAVLGKERVPMLIVDSKDVLRNRASFSARGAGILGLSVFGRDHTYVLDGNYEIEKEAVVAFFKKYNGQRIFIFGFTFMVWQYLMDPNFPADIDLSNAILIHSGGWKKMIAQAVDNQVFKAALEKKFGLRSVYNFYGMIEQIGAVFLENGEGHLHCPNLSEVIIRNPKDFSVQPPGEPGLIQVISLLPESYPGHSLLTEDIGVVHTDYDPVYHWHGKSFSVLRRARKAELRGCSDTFQK